jgi:DNA primase
VQLVTKQSFVESVKYLADLCGLDLNNQEQFTKEYMLLKQQQEMLREIRQSQISSPVTSYYPEEVIEEMLPHRSNYFIDRGFSKEILDFYEIGGMVDSRGVQRETIPIRDEDGNLLTISARRTDSDEDPKYILTKDIPKEATLYNLHVAKHYMGENKTLILVEGFVDVWALCGLGIYNVVAIMGTSVTPNQARLLWKYADNIMVMLDADTAGREATPKVVKMLEQGTFVRAIELPDGKDPKNFTQDDLILLGLGDI